MTRTVPHNPDDPAEVAAVATPEDEPNAELIDPNWVDGDDESREEVGPE